MTDYKYTWILNSVFISFMFGFGMPILFIITAGSLLIIYVVEVTALFKAYRQPPKYDEKLSRAVLEMMWWAPALYLAFGYWMASSKQLLSNSYLTPIKTLNNSFVSQHIVTDVFSMNGWGVPAVTMLITLILVLIVILFGESLQESLPECLYVEEETCPEDQADLGNYFCHVASHFKTNNCPKSSEEKDQESESKNPITKTKCPSEHESICKSNNQIWSASEIEYIKKAKSFKMDFVESE